MVRIYTAPNEFIDREMNDEEFDQYKIDKAEAEALQVAKTERAAQRQAIFDRLGLTADEAKLLLG